MPHDWDQRHDSTRLSFEFLKSDAELALTFAISALIHSTPEAAHRSVRHARRAYDYISGRRTEIHLASADASELDTKLEVLKKRLENLGETF